MQQKDSTTVIRSAQSLVMDGMTAPVKMDSLLTMLDIHVKVSVINFICMCVCCVCILCGMQIYLSIIIIILLPFQTLMSVPLIVQLSVILN